MSHPASVHLPKPIRSTPQPKPGYTTDLPLIQRRPDSQYRARTRNRRAHKMQLRPPLNQRLCALLLRDANLGLFIQRERIRALEELVVDRLEGEHGEGHDGWGDEGGREIEFEGQGGGVLCLGLADV